MAHGWTNNRQLKGSPYVPHQRAHWWEADGAVVLHFAVCSFSAFWAKRWAALGYVSPNHRFRGGGGGIDQRAHALASNARRDEARALYRRSVMLDDDAERRRQLDHGVCVRLPVTAAVDAARAAHLPAGAEAAADDAAAGGAPAAAADEGAAAGADAAMAGVGRARIVEVEAEVRRVALRGMAADRSLAALASCALDEAVRTARAEAAAAAALARTPSGRRELAARALPAGDGDGEGDGEVAAARYLTLLQRAAHDALLWLPRPRQPFDLAGYCTHPLASDVLPTAAVAELLRDGYAFVDGALPPHIAEQLDAEVASAAVVGAAAAASTLSEHVRRLWLVSDEAPAAAPPNAAAATAAAATSCPVHGARAALDGAAAPAVAGVLRLLRGLSAQLESVASLRLAVPRAVLLQEHLPAGAAPRAATPNPGWPDSGVEVVATLFVRPPPAIEAHTAARRRARCGRAPARSSSSSHARRAARCRPRRPPPSRSRCRSTARGAAATTATCCFRIQSSYGFTLGTLYLL